MPHDHEALADTASLEHFLAGVERRAYRMACVGTGDQDAALDIVQEAMLRLVRHYRKRPEAQWRPLFFRILGNAINDWHRQRQRRWTVFDRWFDGRDDDTADPLEQSASPAAERPDRIVGTGQMIDRLEIALRNLSARQQQAFMLRCWEGLSTAETAVAMQCSQGTVKTLYSRAIHSLRNTLEADVND